MATPLMRAVHSLGYKIDVWINSRHPDAHFLFDGIPFLRDIYHSLPRKKYSIVLRTAWNQGGNLNCGKEFRVGTFSYAEHEAEVNLRLARNLGFKDAMPEPCCGFLELVIDPGRYVIIAPGCGSFRDMKAWMYWESLCKYLAVIFEKKIIILGEKEDYEPWMDTHEHYLNKVNIGKAAGFIKGADFVVSVDNGLAHIAAALGRPTIVIFGPSSTIKNKPLGKRVVILKSNLNCVPCQTKKEFPKFCSKDRECLRRIGITKVISALLEEGYMEQIALAV